MKRHEGEERKVKYVFLSPGDWLVRARLRGLGFSSISLRSKKLTTIHDPAHDEYFSVL